VLPAATESPTLRSVRPTIPVRRGNRGKVKIQLRLIECGAGSLDFSLRGKIGLYRIGVVLLAGDFLVEKFRLTLLVLHSFLLFGNCPAELGFRLLERGFIWPWINP
jgi:hypothetical protein